MAEREESMKYYHSRESENEEQKRPSYAMMTIVNNQPHPVCITKLFFMQKTQISMESANENQLKINKNMAPWYISKKYNKLIDKPNCLPIIKKELSLEELDDQEGKVRKINSGSSVAEINEQKSNRSQSSARSAKSARHSKFDYNQIINGEPKKKQIRRMNSKIKARLSKMQNLKQKSALQKIVSQFIEGWAFSILMAIVTLYALFGDDIRILSVNKDQDDIFFILTIISMSFFTLEIILTSIANPNYILNVNNQVLRLVLFLS